MECRKFELTIVSADNLPDVWSFGRMKVYAEVSINGEPDTSMRTTVDTDGETKPRWNCPVNLSVKALFDYGPRVGNVLSFSVDGAEGGKHNILYSFGNIFMAPKPLLGKKVLDAGIKMIGQGTLFFLSGDF